MQRVVDMGGLPHTDGIQACSPGQMSRSPAAQDQSELEASDGDMLPESVQR